MLCVKTIVKSSELEGLGLFAAEKISKGTVVWKFDSHFDHFFDPAEVENMDPLQKEFMKRYAYLSIPTGKYVLCADDARFMNHSASQHNLAIVDFPGEPETRAVANKDINPGEEILVNYREIDTQDADSNEEYLSR